MINGRAVPFLAACLMLPTPTLMAGAADEQRVTLTVWAPANREASLGSSDMSSIQSLLEEQTGVRIDWLQGAQESEFAALVVSIASGHAPDMLSNMPDEYYDYMVEQGVLRPLDGFLDLRAEFPSISEDLWTQAETGGRVYGVPQRTEPSGQPLIRQDWLVETGQKEPAAMDDYITILREFKNQYPDVTPMTGIPSTVWGGFSPFCRYYGACNIYEERDGRIVDTRVQPEIKNYLETLRKLVEEGLLDPEFAENDRAKVARNITSGTVGIWSPRLWSFNDVAMFTEKNPEGRYELVEPESNAGSVECQREVTFSGITVDSLNPEKTIELLSKYQDVFNSVRPSMTQCSPYEGVLAGAKDGISEYDQVAESLTELTTNSFNRIILGSESVELGFRNYLQEWERLGGQTALTSVSEWWSASSK